MLIFLSRRASVFATPIVVVFCAIFVVAVYPSIFERGKYPNATHPNRHGLLVILLAKKERGDEEEKEGNL